MFRSYLFFGVIVLVRAQIPSFGFCPDYLPMNDFDIDNFLGKWYETERYFQFSDIISRCVVTDYAKAPSGKIYVSNEVTNRITGVKRIIDGQLELSGRVGEGKLNVRYTTTPLSSQATLIVLDTDYDNYAVIWNCNGFGLLNAQSVWVMTRERLPPGPVLQKVYGILDKFKISRSFFVKTDQEGCALAASDINAANGITAQSTVPQATGEPQRKLPLLGINVNIPKIIKQATRHQSDTDRPEGSNFEAVKFTGNKSNGVQSVTSISGVVKSAETLANHAVVKEPLPEAKNDYLVNSEPDRSKTSNSVASTSANIVSEAVKSNAESNVKSSENQLNPLKVSENIPENNLIKQNEPGLELKINLEKNHVPEKSSEPNIYLVSEVVKEIYVPLKTAIEEKVLLTETKTN